MTPRKPARTRVSVCPQVTAVRYSISGSFLFSSLTPANWNASVAALVRARTARAAPLHTAPLPPSQREALPRAPSRPALRRPPPAPPPHALRPQAAVAQDGGCADVQCVTLGQPNLTSSAASLRLRRRGRALLATTALPFSVAAGTPAVMSYAAITLATATAVRARAQTFGAPQPRSPEICLCGPLLVSPVVPCLYDLAALRRPARPCFQNHRLV